MCKEVDGKLEYLQGKMDDKFLEEIALNEKDRIIRLQVIEKISDKEILMRLHLMQRWRYQKEDDIILKKLVALNVYDDDEFTFGEFDETKRDKKIIQNVTSSKTLVYVAINNNDSKIREIAVKKIEDGEILKVVALKDASPIVRIAALKKVNDCETLKYVALNDKKHYVRVEAINRILDQAILKNITVNKSECTSLRIAAVRKITDENFLLNIAITDENHLVKMQAIEKILNQEKLFEIITTVKELDIREYAVQKFTDVQTLIKISLSDKNEKMAIKVMQRLQALKSKSSINEVLEKTTNWYLKCICKDLLKEL